MFNKLRAILKAFFQLVTLKVDSGKSRFKNILRENTFY